MRCPLFNRRNAGFSLPEMIVSIGVIAVIAGISLAAFTNVFDNANLVQAQRINAQLNAGLKGFGQTNWEIRTARDDANTTDELKVLRSLQYRPSASLGRYDVSAPYFSPNWNPVASNNTEDFRVRWNGANFQLLVPGKAGKGLKLAFDGSDQSSTPYSFPANYKPEGP